MKDERMQILLMVQEGKLSPDEAAKLLEALEPGAAGSPAAGPKPTHIRVVVTEGGRPKSISVGLGLARWVLSMPGLMQFHLGEQHRFDNDALLEAIASGRVGKIFEAGEGRKRIEIWLDA